jgi:hypothetical protein
MSNPESKPKEPSDSHVKAGNRDSGSSTLSMQPQEETQLDHDSQWQPSKPSAPMQTPIYSTPAPAPLTSDIHNAGHEHDQPNSDAEGSSRPHTLSSPMLRRFMTVNPDDSSLKYAALIAINEGRVQVGEDMLERRWRENRDRGVW